MKKLTLKERKLVKEYAKSLIESPNDIRSVIKNIPIDTAQKLEEYYYSIADNITPIVDLLNSINKETPSNIISMEVKLFKKIQALLQDSKFGKVL